MKTTLITLLSLIAPCLALCAQSAVMLSWDPNVETNCMGYKVLSGTASRIYTATNVVPGKASTTTIVSNVPSGRVFFALVAFDQSGLDSDFSNEVSWTNRLAAPKNFKLIGTFQASASPTGPWKDLAKMDVPLPTNEVAQFYRSKLLLEELPTP